MANVNLTWGPPVSGGAVDTYTLYKMDGSQTDAAVMTTPGNAAADTTSPSYVDTTAYSGMVYSYIVTAKNVAGEGDPSNIVVVTTPA